MKRVTLSVLVLCALMLSSCATSTPYVVMFDADGYLTEEGMSTISKCMPDMEYTQVVEGDAVYLYAVDQDTNEPFLAYKVHRETLYGGYPTVVSAGYIVGQMTTERLPEGYGRSSSLK